MSENGTSGLSEDQRVGHLVEMWKQATQVNQHFNDIGWRIRGLALTVATFSIGAAGVASRDGTDVFGLSVGSLLLLVGLLLWYAFYFIDVAGYHQLLRASVRQTEVFEEEIGKSLPISGLAAAITAGSPYEPNRFVRWLSMSGETMQSTDKIRWFYRVGAAALVLVAVGLQIYTMQAEEPSSGSEVPSHHDSDRGRHVERQSR